jgi:hypothetical protein
MLVDCPAFLTGDGAIRCGLPAEVQARYTVGSTGGPVECAKIRCPRGHWFNGPVECLSAPEVATAVVVDPAKQRSPRVRGPGIRSR